MVAMRLNFTWVHHRFCVSLILFSKTNNKILESHRSFSHFTSFIDIASCRSFCLYSSVMHKHTTKKNMSFDWFGLNKTVGLQNPVNWRVIFVLLFPRAFVTVGAKCSVVLGLNDVLELSLRSPFRQWASFAKAESDRWYHLTNFFFREEPVLHS